VKNEQILPQSFAKHLTLLQVLPHSYKPTFALPTGCLCIFNVFLLFIKGSYIKISRERGLVTNFNLEI
jgi:hypothetical protein